MLLFLFFCLLYCNIFNVTEKLITLIITSRSSVILSSKHINLVGHRYAALLNQSLVIWFLFSLKCGVKVGHFYEDLSSIKFLLDNSIKEADVMLWRWAHTYCCSELVDNGYLPFKLSTRKLSEKAQVVLCILLNPYKLHNFILHLQLSTELHGSQT